MYDVSLLSSTFANNMIVVWFSALILFLAIEALTMGLASIWFALGSLGALICAVVVPAGRLIWLQVLIFLAISAVTMYFTRPLAKRYLHANRRATNADRVLDMIGVVREPIDNLAAQGTVYVNGKLWTARSDDGGAIAAETRVKILRIEGVKLIVLPEAAVSSAEKAPDGTET